MMVESGDQPVADPEEPAVPHARMSDAEGGCLRRNGLPGRQRGDEATWQETPKLNGCPAHQMSNPQEWLNRRRWGLES
jgi:hypothetical protein